MVTRSSHAFARIRAKPPPILWLILWLDRRLALAIVDRVMVTRTRNKLNVKQVASLSKVGVYSDGGGLYLRVRPSGRSWIYIGTLNGKRLEMGLGSAWDVTLAKAREKASAVRAMLLDGQDPRQMQAKAVVPAAPVITFGKFALEHASILEEGFKNPKHRQQWRYTLTKYAAPIFDIPIAEVSTEDVLSVLQPIWLAKAETASRLRGRIERVLDAARVKGLREGDNPARGKGHLNLLLPAQKKTVRHHPALPFKEIGKFVAALRQREGMAARGVEMAILTAARSGEIRGMVWGEVNLEEKVWVVPAERMKAGVEHHVPLSDAAMAVLRSVREEGVQPDDCVFPAPRGGTLSDMTLTKLLERMKRKDITVHGFRSTFRDWAGDMTDFDNEVCEMALAHTIKSAVKRAYRRERAFEKRVLLMAAWAEYIQREVERAA